MPISQVLVHEDFGRQWDHWAKIIWKYSKAISGMKFVTIKKREIRLKMTK